MPFDLSSIMPMLQRMFSGGAPGTRSFGPPPVSRGPGGKVLKRTYNHLTRPQGAGGMGSLLAALPTILQSAPGIFKAITSDPGFQSRMQQNKQNQQVTPGTTPPTTPPSASTPTLPPTTIPPVTQTPPVTPTPSATAVSGNTGGRVNMPTQPGDTGGPVNMPTQPGDTGGQVQY